MDKDFCIVFVCNERYLDRFIYTCSQLLTVGKYKGKICLVVGDDLRNEIYDVPFIRENFIIIKYFPDIKFPDEFIKLQYRLNRLESQHNKIFQFHKMYIFDIFFKRWKYILYLDSGLHIYSDITPIINNKPNNCIYAHSDSYPHYNWKLSCQFDKTKTSYFNKLNDNYDINIDYFQTTIMYIDTNIIEDNTFNDLYNLAIENPICNTNEQGIISLYFCSIKKLWKQIPYKDDKEDDVFYYDFLSRTKKNKYIMVKNNNIPEI